MVNILCWNVAGWGPTIEFVKKDYGCLKHYFKLHNADIVCLQEFKQTNKSVEEKPAAVAANEEGRVTPRSTCRATLSVNLMITPCIQRVLRPWRLCCAQVGSLHVALQASSDGRQIQRHVERGSNVCEGGADRAS